MRSYPNSQYPRSFAPLYLFPLLFPSFFVPPFLCVFFFYTLFVFFIFFLFSCFYFFICVSPRMYVCRKNPFPSGEFPCWVVSKPRTRRKRTPPAEQPPKCINFGSCSSGGVQVSSSGFLARKPPKKGTSPGGGGFLQSTWPLFPRMAITIRLLWVSANDEVEM